MPLKKGINEIDRYLATGNADVNLGFETFVRLIGKTFDKDVPLKKSCRKTCWKKVKKSEILGHNGNKAFSES